MTEGDTLRTHLAALRRAARAEGLPLVGVRADLEDASGIPARPGSCGAILVFRFLSRTLAPAIVEALASPALRHVVLAGRSSDPQRPDVSPDVTITTLDFDAGDPTTHRDVVAAAVEAMRDLNLYKPPGVAETIDWATALGRLGATRLDEQLVANTLGTVLKYREDHQRVDQHGIADVVRQAFEHGLLHG